MERELRAIVGDDGYLSDPGRYSTDITGMEGKADAVVLPASADEVAAVVAWCYEHDVPITPRGGGTGVAAGAVPLDGGIVLALDRLDRVRQFDPLLWRMHVEAGVKTATVHSLARDSGLMFAPDPGAAEQSQIGGNIATNAAGPHAYKYGATGTWVTGLEAVVAPGRGDLGRRADPQGRGRLRPEEPADRLRGNARDRHRGVATARAGTGGGATGRRVPAGHGGGLRGDPARRRQRHPGDRDRVPGRRDACVRGRLVRRQAAAGGRRVHGHRRGGRVGGRGCCDAEAS